MTRTNEREAQDEANDSEMSALDRERRQTNHSGSEVCFPAAQLAAWVVILVESVIMSICTDFSWLVAILVFQYCILIIIDSKHLLSIVQCITEWGLAVVFTIMVFVRQMAL